MMNIDYSHRGEPLFGIESRCEMDFRQAHFTSTEDRWRENVIFVWQATVRLVRNRSALPTVLRQRVQVTFWIHEFNFVRFTLSRRQCQPDLLKALYPIAFNRQ